MKYRIYRYAVKNGTIQNVKVDIKTDDIEKERKMLEDKHGHTIHLYYETNEPYEEEKNHSFSSSTNRRGTKCN